MKTPDNPGLYWEIKSQFGLRSASFGYYWYNPDPAHNGGDAGVHYDIDPRYPEWPINYSLCTFDIDTSCDTYGYVQAVNSIGLCGAHDWRLPTMNELIFRKRPPINNRFYTYIISDGSGPIGSVEYKALSYFGSVYGIWSSDNPNLGGGYLNHAALLIFWPFWSETESDKQDKNWVYLVRGKGLFTPTVYPAD